MFYRLDTRMLTPAPGWQVSAPELAGVRRYGLGPAQRLPVGLCLQGTGWGVGGSEVGSERVCRAVFAGGRGVGWGQRSGSELALRDVSSFPGSPSTKSLK